MSTVAIKIDGTDITDDVMILGASFASLVNGAMGQAAFRVKDVDQTYAFNSGDSLTLDIDGERVWGGFVMQAKKVYALPVIDSSQPGGVTRVWQVMGLDYNVLFNKRIVWKESDPTGKLAFEYSTDTYDDTIIDDIFDHYLTISGDGLTRGGVTRIAKATLDLPGLHHKGLLASAGYTWKQMMDSVQRATGGVYYISPDKVLTYVDAETTTSSHALSDTPSGSDIGYQRFSILKDGVNLVNDMMVWGAGTGSPNYVFSRTQDAPSIADHGRWQQGLVTSGIFRQSSADIVADSYVYGTPQSHRGGKDDAIVFNARVFQPVYRAGDIVDIECAIFGYSDTLPLRSMTITFASPTKPIFDLVLTHAIDQALSLYEYLDLRIKLPPLPGINVDHITPQPPTGVTGCQDCTPMTVFDDWSRSNFSDMGTATPGGTAWNLISSANDASAYVNGNGILDLWQNTPPLGAPHPAVQVEQSDGGPWQTTAWVMTTTLNCGANDPTDVGSAQFTVYNPDLTASIRFGLDWELNRVLVTDVTDPSFALDVNKDYNLKWDVWAGVYDRVKVWAVGDPEPTTWLHDSGPTTVDFPNSYFGISGLGTDPFGVTPYEPTIFIGPVAFGHNRCADVQFDDFNRSDSGWGTATPGGQAWTTTGDAFTNGSSGALLPFDSGSALAQSSASIGVAGPWDSDFDLTAKFLFLTVPGGSSPTSSYAMLVGGAASAKISFEPSATNGEVTLWSGSGVPVVGTNAVQTSLPWTANVWYRIRWDHRRGSTGTDKVRIWLDGTAEPSTWDLTLATGGTPGFSGTLSGPLFELDDIALNAHGSERWYFDWIDFDYTGKPCYIDCSGSDRPTTTETENFNRTVAPGNVLGTSTFTGTPTWVRPGGGSGAASVDGSEAVFTNGAFPKVGFINDIDPFDRGFPLSLLTKFQFTNDYGTGSNVQFGWQFFPAAGNFVFVLTTRSHIGAFPADIYSVDLYAASYDGSFNVINEYETFIDSLDYTLADGTWYLVRAELTESVMHFRIWVDGDPEPSTWTGEIAVTGEISQGLNNDNRFRLNVGASNGGTSTGWVDFIEITSSLCAPVPPGDGGVPVSGRVCETIFNPGDTNTFQTSMAFYSGTLNEVYVNGIQQVGVTSNGGSDGVFMLTHYLHPEDVLYVCYNSNGPVVV